MDEDNDLAQAEQRDVPGGEELQRSWLTALASEAHQVGTTLLDAAALYGAKKAVDKIRKPPPPPTAPGPRHSQDGGSAGTQDGA
jgi:hypothetical protein